MILIEGKVTFNCLRIIGCQILSKYITLIIKCNGTVQNLILGLIFGGDLISTR